MKQIRTRIAPSPTGEDLHIGNAYTALINYVLAKKHGGQFIVRIEDTDRTRLVEGSEQQILSSLAWLGIPHDEGPDIGGKYGPYRQSDRLQLYQKHAEELATKGHAYYCFCTPLRLAEMRKAQEASHQPPMYDGLCRDIPPSEAQKRIDAGEKYVIRLKTPKDGITTFTDVIRGQISFENKLIDDQVLLKSDKFPTYHLGVVVDDHLMQITHIIRGEEWISSTPKHILLYEFFGWEKPIYAHMPLLRNPDKSKLSKRKNPVWVSWYREQGFSPEAVRNYLALMAWSYPEDKEIFTTEEMMTVFTLERIQTTAPVFNIEKLRWINGEYIRKTQNSILKAQIETFFAGKYTGDLVEKILPLVKERMKTFVEFESLAGFFFDKPISYEKSIDEKQALVLIQALTDCDWTHLTLEQAIRDAAAKEGIKPKELFMALRILISGKTVGPPLMESLEILGRAETLSRLGKN
ncbi:glutamate--tRNA ligase [Candidatus Gottesmanbacteria bacterium RBG_16_43_7]|uniref:Glutamate--tRNA ligase n=1 Tax=Candidatus Gottesmanbacteria bacterium RBG_16_43_7 TaxID=1798373 RepID=A0A1F5Z942_9BACT|nr:MAG: glutamate--tRNA ligase [Candidatus Gottesmanbacteria bacterium RBG_16_43_7]